MKQGGEGGGGHPPGYGATVAALALGQIIAWAALYYGFTSFVLPMQRSLGWPPGTWPPVPPAPR